MATFLTVVDSLQLAAGFFNTVPECAVGEHVFTLEVSDGHHTSSDNMVLTVEP
jgi:hypothetical protein